MNLVLPCGVGGGIFDGYTLFIKDDSCKVSAKTREKTF